ncbi:MAG: adenylate/guanylate cyclase domain-containing protein [Actinomycetota bacterium]
MTKERLGKDPIQSSADEFGSSLPVAAPSGFVTFLITDIERSTRLWEEHPRQMRHALERHDHELGRIFESFSGYVFANGGDSLAVAFQDPVNAVRAAVLAQLATDELVVAGQGLRLRMAIHTGRAVERDCTYFGPVLNRCARLCDAAHGGQILMSAVAERTLSGSDRGIDLLDLGDHWLRDLEQPERVYQVVAPQLMTAFPQLRATAVAEVPIEPAGQRRWLP